MESVIAGNVKNMIKNECLLQKAVAAKAGYDYKAFSNMLNGRKVITDIDVLNIANALGVYPNELYGIKKDTGQKEVG